MASRKKDLINDTTMIGVCLAMIISYSEHHHILLAMFHGLLNWIYVIYYSLRFIF